MKINTKLIIIMVLGVLGIFNAFYLSYDWIFAVDELLKVTGNSSFCNINETFSCSTVMDHPLSKIYGVPFSVVALFVYPIILLVALLGYFKKITKHFKILFFMAIGGILFNGYFIYQETFNIGAFCPLCLMCTVYIITIAGLSGCEVKKECIANKKNKNV